LEAFVYLPYVVVEYPVLPAIQMSTVTPSLTVILTPFVACSSLFSYLNRQVCVET
jgi:hypothetical protein